MIELNRLQRLFVEWNAKRLSISEGESMARFVRSWKVLEHNSEMYRAYITAQHELLQVFFDDSPEEAEKAYRMHQYIHMLRWLIYEPHPIDTRCVDGIFKPVVMDFGCGMANLSIEYALEVGAKLVLVDIQTIMTDFLRYVVDRLDIDAVILDIRDELPRCDVAIVTEVWEHLHYPLLTFQRITDALYRHGYLITDGEDRGCEMFHVSCDLSAIRKQLERDYIHCGGMYHRKECA